MKLKRIILLLLTVMFSFSYGEVFAKDGNSLKKALKNKFLIGVSVNTHQSSGKDVAAVEIVKKNFNSIVAENCMKSSVIHPKENKYNFAQADEFVSFGESNQMAIIGHCLIWHSQLAPWFCVDKDGNNVSPEVLKKRMKDHITTIVKRYKGRIKGWDVVNEAIEDNGAYRKTKFYEILGEEYIPLAFQYAHEADPDAELYYNDYSMAQPGRREAVVKMVNDLKKRGIRIDAIGMQGHIGMDYRPRRRPTYCRFCPKSRFRERNPRGSVFPAWDPSSRRPAAGRRKSGVSFCYAYIMLIFESGRLFLA